MLNPSPDGLSLREYVLIHARVKELIMAGIMTVHVRALEVGDHGILRLDKLLLNEVFLD